jgi:hypothetical protein
MTLGQRLHELFSLSPIKDIIDEVMRGAIMPCLNPQSGLIETNRNQLFTK